jgi:hypothetical protein
VSQYYFKEIAYYQLILKMVPLGKFLKWRLKDVKTPEYRIVKKRQNPRNVQCVINVIKISENSGIKKKSTNLLNLYL